MIYSLFHGLGQTFYKDFIIIDQQKRPIYPEVRAKIFGHRLEDDGLQAIVRDVAVGLYSEIEIAAFIAACAGTRLDATETIALTRAMIAVGERLCWNNSLVVDKHCVGGLPGNRTSLIVVPIVAAFGLIMPKTSSRAITSPAGSADVMETLTEVALDVPAMRRVVEAVRLVHGAQGLVRRRLRRQAGVCRAA